LSIAIAACATIVLLPNQIEATSLSQVVMPVHLVIILAASLAAIPLMIVTRAGQ
jgi:hypothetical protein